MNSETTLLPPPPYLSTYPKELLYREGYPVSYKLVENIQDLKLRVARNKAAMIICDGGVGEGKTTLGVAIADLVQGSLIDLEKQVAMGGKQFLKKAEKCYDERLPVIVYDEAGDFNRRGALKQFNAMLNRFFETYRAYKIVVIVCVPDFAVLDRQLFNNKIPRMVLHLHGRTERQGNFRAYSLYRAFWVLENMRKLPVKDKAFQKTDPNFYGHFKDLPAERRAALAAMSTSNKKDILKESRLQMDGFLSVQDIVKKVGMSQPWVSGKLRELEVEPVEKSGHKNYYTADVVRALERAIKSKARGGK